MSPAAGQKYATGQMSLRSFSWSPQPCPIQGLRPLQALVDISIDRWQPRDHGDPRFLNYAHNTRRLWPILFNQNVDLVAYHFQTWLLGAGDSFYVPSTVLGEWCKINNDHITFTANAWCGNSCEPALNPLCNCDNTQDFNEWFAGNVGVHELAHCYQGLPDEYHWWYACGHSIMRSFDGRRLNTVDYCSYINGGKNPTPPWLMIPHPQAQNNWACLESNFPSFPSYPADYTPDPFFDTAEQSDGDQPFDMVQIVEHWPW